MLLHISAIVDGDVDGGLLTACGRGDEVKRDAHCRESADSWQRRFAREDAGPRLRERAASAATARNDLDHVGRRCYPDRNRPAGPQVIGIELDFGDPRRTLGRGRYKRVAVCPWGWRLSC